jgi:dUTPase
MTGFTIHHNSTTTSVQTDACEFTDIPFVSCADGKKMYIGANAIDVLHRADALLEYETDLFSDSRFASFGYRLLDANARAPHKHRTSDTGFDLTLINIKRTIGKVVMYGTGISVSPPIGFYFDLVPRSSMIKSGYILANSVGIIDQGYTGEIMVPLIKVDPDAPELPLPITVVQLIPRKWYGFSPVEHTDNSASSLRGTGGF